MKTPRMTLSFLLYFLAQGSSSLRAGTGLQALVVGEFSGIEITFSNGLPHVLFHGFFSNCSEAFHSELRILCRDSFAPY
jgi:hypothetical protein